jgi:hypothetical protein
MSEESDMELKGKPAQGHSINFCDTCDGLFCEVCSDAESSALYCSQECEDDHE